MKELYGIDMEAEGQHSKLIHEIPDEAFYEMIQEIRRKICELRDRLKEK